ncbi:DUF2938 domain-containing protein [Dokdonella sp.]|uniref:DUF2938 domain-containing protein n=1 Tax=Dokdonella sp. TaxID=2291710 RepID=UPI002F3EBB63
MGALHDNLVCTVAIGIVATAFMDAAAIVRRRVAGTPLPDYALVGRWIAWMPRGRFRHAAIARSPSMRGERALGWIAHYATGVGYAGVLLAFVGLEWVRDPTVLPALAVGIGSVLVPFLLMQPGMGAGIAGSRTADPARMRMRSLVTHAVFGVGLYVGAWMVRLVAP